MAFDYEEIRATADEIIEEYGAPAQVTRVTTGQYNPETATAPTTSVITDTFAAVFDYGTDLIDGTRILTGDKQVFMKGSVIPKPDDIFTFGTKVYRIIAVKELAPAGVNVLSELQVRR
jgi:hypothetical protein